MAQDVVMPQMGESIAEGTVSKWLKQVGDKVERDEPLLEISTDKVDAEIPSPAAGVLTEILAKEGDTVPVNAVVARISAEGEASAPAEKPAAEPAAAEAPKPAEAPKSAEQQAANESMAEEVKQEAPAAAPDPQAAAAQTTSNQQPATPPATPPEGDEAEGGEVTSLDERRRTKSSPLVRKIAAENNVDITQIPGTGVSGRVTKNDILDFLQQPPKPAAAAAAAPAAPSAPAPAPSRPAAAPQAYQAPQAPKIQFAEGANVQMEPLSVMRKKIAQHMIQSKQTSAHVHTVFEIDFTNVEKLRRRHKDAYAERGVKLTYMPFIVQAVIAGLREFPILNASMDDTNVVYHRDFNIGIAVALEWGLIVPVLKRADELNILGASRAINDLGDRARTKKLMPDDVQGGTFTITNPGVYGGLFGLPIINQPQVAILGVGGIKKRPMVVETPEGDFIAIRSMCYFSLGFDHRLIDGAVADQFMARVKSIIEAGQFTM
ncbi:MAG TPA: 2-oxoglutarate dehydrogenase, E2 component, dihydrolipoamide succinyltransferase [Thermoanaerobaculia bacterium]|nr:2-oxoglutarate dehydrogenase, E2 component, dihydrolipoamide succinyltransferase [Thermoanaerobaculia bacterium]